MVLILKIKHSFPSLLLEIASELVSKGEIVVYPTETAYAVGCRITSKKAVERIYKIKKRSTKKALPVIMADEKMAKKYCFLDKTAGKLMKKFMPGALSLIVPKKKNIPSFLAKKEIAFRLSSNKVAQKLCKAVGEPLVSTSANIEGKAEKYSAEEAIKELGEEIDIVIDAGRIPKRKPSTIWHVKEERIVRKGKISEKEILKALGKT